MTIKREAALHEAGHAVAAYRSRFHDLGGPINLASYGAGEIYISLSKKKLAANGKSSDPSVVHRDRDVAKDLAVVLCAGLAAEQIAAECEVGIQPDPLCSQPDYQLLKKILDDACLSKKTDRHEQSARDLLESEWKLVLDLSDYLFQNVTVDPVEILEFIESPAISAPKCLKRM